MAVERSFKQELTGVFGYPVSENPTRAMIEPAYRALGLDWRYLTVEVPPERLRDAVSGARAMGWKGFNCTIPHKVAVLEFVDVLSPAAAAIGAANCVVDRDGVWMGENTDGKGFVESLRAVRRIEGARAAVLGSGGAARAIAVELGLAGAARVSIAARNPSKAESLADAVRLETPADAEALPWRGPFRIPEGTDVLVQATSIGLFPDVDAEVPLDPNSLDPRTIVCDVIPNPPRTRLLRLAAAKGCDTLDGLGMLVNQGAIGIRLWTGLQPDPNGMRRSLEEIFSSS